MFNQVLLSLLRLSMQLALPAGLQLQVLRFPGELPSRDGSGLGTGSWPTDLPPHQPVLPPAPAVSQAIKIPAALRFNLTFLI